MFAPKFREGTWGPEDSRERHRHAIDSGRDQYRPIWERGRSAIFYDVNRLCLRQRRRRYVGLYKKGKTRVQVIVQLGNILCNKSYSSRTHV